MEEMIKKLILGTVQDAISDNDYEYIDGKIYVNRGNLEMVYTVDKEMLNNIVRKLEELDETERDY